MRYILKGSIFLLIITTILTSCQSKEQKVKKKIAKLEAVEILEGEQQAELAEAYETYANLMPDDSAARPYLFNSAKMYLELGNFEGNVRASDTFMSRYPGTMESNLLIMSKSKGLHGLKKYGEAIETMREYIAINPRLTSEEMSHLGVLYQDYIEQNPEDSLAKKYQLELANVMSTLGNKEGAVAEFKRFYTTYPDSDNAPYAMMQAADISDKHLGDTAEARVILNELIAKHPNHQFGQEAQVILEKGYLGKTNAEILQDILSKQ